MPMTRLGDVARLFLTLGATAFGGPAAHIAMMHEQVVRRRRWMTDGEFADLIAAVNLIPGPNSTELAIHVGRRVAGWRGFAMAGVCFIAPATAIVALMAAAYVRYGSTPDARAAMSGISPIVIAIIAHAAWQLASTSLKSATAWIVAAVSLALALFGVHELIVLLAAGLTVLSVSWGRRAAATAVIVAGCSSTMLAASATASSASLVKLFLFFLKVGSILFGSGYVLLAFLRADLVERWGWLTEQQLLDAIAVGQFTPGPLFTTATFIGYLLGGLPGALLSTIAIFLPAFVFVGITHRILPRLRASARVSAFLDGVVAASLALMVAVAVTIGSSTLRSPLPIALAAAAFAMLSIWRMNSVWLVLAGAAIGVMRA
jgi:chromate transporter